MTVIRESQDLKVGVCAFSAAIGVLLAVWILISAMEARAFTRLTGKQVTTWDAMWTDLRIQEPVK